MSRPAPTYDLLMLLDPQADDAVRAKLVADAREAIEQEGELLRHDDWGDRPLAYPIERKPAAEYHLLQFHTAAPGLLQGLDRTLRIADEVLRFRIIKLRPGVPQAPDMRAAPAARRGEPGQPAAPAEVAAAARADTPAAPPAKAQTDTEAQTDTPAEAQTDAPAEAEANTPAEPAPER